MSTREEWGKWPERPQRRPYSPKLDFDEVEWTPIETEEPAWYIRIWQLIGRSRGRLLPPRRWQEIEDDEE